MVNNSRIEFLTKRQAQKIEELGAIGLQLEGTLSKRDELKLDKLAKQLLEEIEKIEEELSGLYNRSDNANERHLSLEKTFQKIDNDKGKKITKMITQEWGDESGASLLFFQRYTRQNGIYCLNECFDLIVGDRKIGEEIIGDYRPYEIDLSSPVSEFSETEFSQRLLSYFDPSLNDLKQAIKKLSTSLSGGSIIFIKIKNWDELTNKETFITWFINQFWLNLIREIKPIFQEYAKIRIVTVLIAKSQVFDDCCSEEHFCTEEAFDPCRILEIPLPDWSVEDIQKWLINYRGLSKQKSLVQAQQIHQESEGIPNVICTILKERFNA